MKKVSSFFLFVIVLCLFIKHISAQSISPSPKRDPRVATALEQIKVEYTVSPEGFYKVTYAITEKRRQSAIIHSETEVILGKEMRLLLSYASIDSKTIAPDVANLLLEQNVASLNFWGIAKGKKSEIVIVNQLYLPADADGKTLDEALQSIAVAADKIEERLAKADAL